MRMRYSLDQEIRDSVLTFYHCEVRVTDGIVDINERDTELVWQLQNMGFRKVEDEPIEEVDEEAKAPVDDPIEPAEIEPDADSDDAAPDPDAEEDEPEDEDTEEADEPAVDVAPKPAPKTSTRRSTKKPPVVKTPEAEEA